MGPACAGGVCGRRHGGGSNSALDNLTWRLYCAIEGGHADLDSRQIVRFARKTALKDPGVLRYTPDGHFERDMGHQVGTTSKDDVAYLHQVQRQAIRGAKGPTKKNEN